MAKRPAADGRSEIATRVVEGLRVLLDRPADDAARPMEPLAEAVDLLGSMVDRLHRGAAALRAASPAAADRVVVVGGEVDLVAQLSPVGRRLGRTVRFFRGDALLGETTVGALDRATLFHRAAEPGAAEIRYEVAGRTGRVLLPREESSPFVLQVLGGAPAVAIDTDSLLVARDATVAWVRALERRGASCFFVDVHEVERRAEVRAAVDASGLGPRAVLGHAAANDFETLGVDFRPVFAVVLLRRVLMNGVPLAGVLTDDPALRAAAEREGLDAWSAEERLDRAAARVEGVAKKHAALAQRRAAAPSEASFRLGVATGARLVPGNLCRVELDNRAAREALFTAIDEAKREILLQFYIFESCAFTEALAVRLIRRARAGVRIRLLVDALYSQQGVLGATNPILEGLAAEPNVEVVASEPIATPDRIETLRLKVRDHRKLAVFDGERALVSGRNAGDVYYTGFDEVPIADFTHHDRIPWLDAHVEVEGPVVADVARCFLEAFVRAGGAPFEPPSVPAPRTGPRAAAARLVVHEGIADANALAAYESILDSARDHVFVVNDFPVLPTLKEAVRRALARGVEVIFLTGNGMARRGDGTFFRGPLYRELFEYMTKHRLEPLLHEGVKAYEYQTPSLPNVVARGGVVRPYVHAKLMTADRRVLSVGSANLDATASYWEREANLVVEGGPEVARVERLLRRMVKQSVRLDPSSPAWRREAPQRELVSRLWPDRVYS